MFSAMERPLRIMLQAQTCAALHDAIMNVKARCVAQGISIAEVRTHPSGTKAALILKVPEQFVADFRSGKGQGERSRPSPSHLVPANDVSPPALPPRPPQRPKGTIYSPSSANAFAGSLASLSSENRSFGEGGGHVSASGNSSKSKSSVSPRTSIPRKLAPLPDWLSSNASKVMVTDEGSRAFMWGQDSPNKKKAAAASAKQLR